MSGEHPDAGPDDELERLRRLLIGLDGAEFDALVRMIREPGQRTAAVAEVISEAVAKRAASDESLGDTLAPTIEGALHRSIDRNPEPIANAIYPVIGPSVRKAITSALADLVTSLNRAVERQFSPRALRWRFEAWRAGLGYTEYLFANNISYAVDHAFLLHRETSLLLQHVAADPDFEADSDMVSSMLSAMATALADFMHDSFQSDSEAARRSWSVDDRTIFVQAGEFAVVALVTRGQPPASKLAAMGDLLDRAHVQYRESLRDFDGDASVFAALRPHLEDLLRERTDDADGSDGAAPGRAPPPAWPFVLVSLLLLAALGAWSWRDFRFGQEARALITALETAPGYVVIASERSGGHLRIEGLRDPLAGEFAALRAEYAPALELESRWRPWFSAEPELLRRRLLRDLAPPDGVSVELRDDVLRLAGVADRAWVERARFLASTVDAVRAVDAEGLVIAAGPAQRLAALRAGIERERLFFAEGVAELDAQQRARVEGLAGTIDAMLSVADGLDRPLRIVVVGQSDGTGTLAVNRALSRERAAAVRSALIDAGLDPARLDEEARIIGEIDADARQVRLEVRDRTVSGEAGQ